VIPVTSTLSADELRALPPVIDLPTAARVLGIGRTVAYRLVRTGEWPTPVLRLGGTIRVPTAPLLALLGHNPAA
jgi:predicted DNA-binding transcriptional regulator AlpA